MQPIAETSSEFGVIAAGKSTRNRGRISDGEGSILETDLRRKNAPRITRRQFDLRNQKQE